MVCAKIIIFIPILKCSKKILIFKASIRINCSDENAYPFGCKGKVKKTNICVLELDHGFGDDILPHMSHDGCISPVEEGPDKLRQSCQT